MKKIRKGTCAEKVIEALAQMGVATSREIGTVIYQISEEGAVRYSKNPHRLYMTMQTLLAEELVETMKIGEKEYLCLTAKGWKWAREGGIKINTECKNLCTHTNDQYQHALASYAFPLYILRSMAVYAFPFETPGYTQMLNAIASNRNNGIKDMLYCGIYISIEKIRKTYEKLNQARVSQSATRRFGMLFRKNEIITLFYMESKNTIMSAVTERDFDNAIREWIDSSYRAISETPPERIAYVCSPTMLFLPSLFHGKKDGLVRSSKKSLIDYFAKDCVSNMCVDRLNMYSRIYVVPTAPNQADYRTALNLYTSEDYENDLARVKERYPQEFNIFICRYPELVSLKDAYDREKKVALVGPNIPAFVDAMSRCMRNRLRVYYDIDTLEEVTFKKYKSNGYPEDEGNEASINHKFLRSGPI